MLTACFFKIKKVSRVLNKVRHPEAIEKTESGQDIWVALAYLPD